MWIDLDDTVVGAGLSAAGQPDDTPEGAERRPKGRDGRRRNRCSRSAFGRYNYTVTIRPPISQERLTQRPDGTLLLEFKKAWKDGNVERADA